MKGKGIRSRRVPQFGVKRNQMVGKIVLDGEIGSEESTMPVESREVAKLSGTRGKGGRLG